MTGGNEIEAYLLRSLNMIIELRGTLNKKDGYAFAILISEHRTDAVFQAQYVSEEADSLWHHVWNY